MENENDGISLVQAINDKFTDDGYKMESFDNIILSCRVPSTKHRNFLKKRVVGLDHSSIETAGDLLEIKSLLPVVEELDLSSNLLSDWNEVMNIVAQLERLTYLNLSHNNLITEISTTSSYHCQSVSKLILNNIKTSLRTLIPLLIHNFPNTSELHMSMNNICNISTDDISEKFSSLKVLHFARNGIQHFRDIENLGKIFPNLTSLNICENPIEQIPLDIDPELSFPHLEKLNIMNTKISDWGSIDNLKLFPKLYDLRIKGSPIYEESEDPKKVRQLIIAQIEKLSILNGSEIDFEERENAERMFIRYANEEKISHSKRYAELIKQYGVLDELAKVNYNIYDIMIKGDVYEPFTYKINITKTAGTLYKELASHLNLSTKQFTLSLYRKGELDYLFTGEQLFKTNKKLEHFRIGDGDYIILRRLDLLP